MPKKKTSNPKSVASKQSPQNPSASKPRGTVDHRRRQEVRQTVKNACDQLNSEGVEPLLQCGLCIQQHRSHSLALEKSEIDQRLELRHRKSHTALLAE